MRAMLPIRSASPQGVSKRKVKTRWVYGSQSRLHVRKHFHVLPPGARWMCPSNGGQRLGLEKHAFPARLDGLGIKSSFRYAHERRWPDGNDGNIGVRSGAESQTSNLIGIPLTPIPELNDLAAVALRRSPFRSRSETHHRLTLLCRFQSHLNAALGFAIKGPANRCRTAYFAEKQDLHLKVTRLGFDL
jgi:hypothetical protein